MLLRILDRLEEVLIAFLMAAATAIIFIAVVHRFGIGAAADAAAGLAAPVMMAFMRQPNQCLDFFAPST